MKRLLLIVLSLFLIVSCTSEAERKAEAERVEAERVEVERVKAERKAAAEKAAAEKAAVEKAIPTEQSNYTQTWKKLLSNKQSADTEARITKSRSILREHIDQKLVVSDWYGKIIEVNTNSILVENNGMKYNLKPKGKNIDYLNFDKGIDILFSGRLIGMGWFASSDNPKIDVECLKITNLGKNDIYFTMIQDEMNWYKKELELEKIIEEGWEEIKDSMDKGLQKVQEKLDE